MVALDIQLTAVRSRRIKKKPNPTTMSHHHRRIAESLAAPYSDSIIDALEDLNDRFLITDPSISGHPIVFASREFLATSGYSRDDVIGQNGRMFQGPKTDRRSVMQIREAIRNEKNIQISLLNYRKDGSAHWILFHLSPVFEEGGRVLHFLAVQVPIGKKAGARAARMAAVGACRDEVRDELRFRCEVFEERDSRGLESEEMREASEWEKQKAINAAKNILSILNYYRKHADKVLCGKRCSSLSISPLGSSLNISLGRIKQSFVLTDPYLPDMPIVYASDAFLSLTEMEDDRLIMLKGLKYIPEEKCVSVMVIFQHGYSRHEVLGQNCRFLNGPDTDIEALQEIKSSIRAEQACSVRLLNYRKDESPFWNLLHISPVRNATGKIAFYVGVQINENSKDVHGLSPEMRQLSAVAAVKVAVRSLSSGASSSSRSSSS